MIGHEARILLSPLLAALVCSPCVAQVWSDEFTEGSVPDPTIWSHDLGAWGWGNQELQDYTDDPANIRVADGALVITARRDAGGRFTSSRIRTQDKLTFQYGTVEARIRIPDLDAGLWPAFWCLGNDFSSVGWPRCGEMDIMEMGVAEAIASGETNRRVLSTAHWDFDGGYASYGEAVTVDSDLDDGFHVWRLEWTPTAIRTFIDDAPIWVMDISDPDGMSGHEFHRPHFLILNLAVGGLFTGITDPAGITADLPAEYVIDYVRIFDNGHTIISGTGHEPPCTGDLDDDDDIDGADLSLLLGAWSSDDPDADLDGSGTVDGADLAIALGGWGACS